MMVNDLCAASCEKYKNAGAEALAKRKAEEAAAAKKKAEEERKRKEAAAAAAAAAAKPKTAPAGTKDTKSNCIE